MATIGAHWWGDDSGTFDLPDLDETSPMEGASGALWMGLDWFDERGAWIARLVVESGALDEIEFVGLAPDERGPLDDPRGGDGRGYVCLVRLTASGYIYPIRGWRHLGLLMKEVGRRAERRRLPEIIREILAEEAQETQAMPVPMPAVVRGTRGVEPGPPAGLPDLCATQPALPDLEIWEQPTIMIMRLDEWRGGGKGRGN